MRFLLLLILPFLISPTAGGSETFAGRSRDDLFSSCLIREPQLTELQQDTVKVKNDTAKAILNSGYIAAPKDTFSYQVGAYKKKENAEKISEDLKGATKIRVRIVVEDGLYKVRVARTPEGEPVVVKDTVSATPAGEQTAVAATDTSHPEQVTQVHKIDTVTAGAAGKQAALAVAPVDTVAMYGEIIFFGNKSPWLKDVRYFGESFTLVNALIITILFSIGSMITLLIIILLHRRKLEKEQKLRQFLMEKYQGLIVDYLYGSATSRDFRPIASDNYSRQVLIDQMIDVSINLKGEESQKLIGLYKHLGLDRDSLSRARDYRWHKKVKGFRELAFMNIKDANASIYKALNSTNDILRMEAQIALVRLNEDNHFDFLSHLKRPFSLWEQIELHDLIIQHDIPVPQFKQWLNSTNDSVVLFSLRMIREFKQADAEEEMHKVLVHNSPEVRLMAVQVAGDLGLRSTLEELKKMYKNQDYKTCLEIVKSMGKMPDTSMLGFLKLVLDKEDDVQLQIEATKSIEKMGEEGVKALVKIMKSEYKNYNIVVRHVLDRRIN
jgi:hypothetical protein